MFRKVSPKSNTAFSLTWTSSFVRFLMKICFFPIYIEGDKVIVKLLSWKTLVHIVVGIWVYLAIIILGFSTSGFADIALQLMQTVS